jgi:VanZ family protein
MFAASSLPGSTYPQVEFFDAADKVVHIAIYAGLAFLGTRAIFLSTSIPTRPGWRWRLVVLGALIAFVYGGLDEIHQAFVPERSPDVLDLVADVLGGLTGGFAFTLVQRWRPRLAMAVRSDAVAS